MIMKFPRDFQMRFISHSLAYLFSNSFSAVKMISVPSVMYEHLTLFNIQPDVIALVISAPLKSALKRSAFVNTVYSALIFVRLVLASLAPLRIALLRSAPDKSPSLKSASVRSAP